MADKKISELDAVLQINNDAVFPISQDDAGEPTTFKAGITQLGAEITEGMTFSNLRTQSKKIIGAINECAQTSGNSFASLTDTDFDNLQNNQIAKYDSTTEKWKNTTIQESDVDGLVSDLEDKADKTDLVYEKTATGSIASFTDGGDDIPVSEYECEIVAQQASGTPTPDNPLPITGFSQADIPVSGLNIFDEEMEVGTLDNSTGATETDANKMRSVNFIPVKPNTTYGVYNNTGVNLYIYSYGSDKSFIGFDNTGMVTGSTFTTDSNTHYIKFRTLNNPSYSNNISINYPSTDTQYHAYNGNLYTVAFGQSIYGGRLIYKDGQWSIEATHGYSLLGDLSWVYDGSRFQTLSLVNDIKKPASGRSADGVMCSNYNASISGTNETFFVYQTGDLYFYDSAYSNADDFKTGNATTQLVYELATPVIIPITSSTRVKTISGDNNIFSNTGDNSVKYFTENADSLAELIKASESESTGDYHEYSTEEHIVGKWIDGHDLYEKTVQFTTPSSNAYTQVSFGVTGVEKCWIHTDTTFVMNATQTAIVGSYIASPQGDQFVGLVTNNNGSVTFDYRVGTNYQGGKAGVATLRYTKTSSNTRSLNLSKGVEETEETDEIKTEEVKEEEKNAEQDER